MKKDSSFFNRNILELYFKLLPVQIFLMIASGLSGIVNGLIIGNMLTPTAMSALGLSSPLVNLLNAVATIVSGGSGILCGKFMGRGEAQKVNSVFSNAMIVLTLAGAILSAACFLLATPLATLLGAGVETHAETVLFIRGTALGLIPMMLIPCLMVFLQMCNKSGVSLFSTILLAAFNTVFCLLNVQVLKGGILSVALANSFSKLAALAFLIAYLYFKKNLVHFDRGSLDRRLIREMLFLGSPGSLAGILYSLRNIFINIFAARIAGVTAVNALAILGSCGCFLDSLNVGVGNSLSMLASVFVGERDSRSLKDLMKIAAFVGMALCCVKFLVVYPFGANIAQIFGAQGDVIGATRDLLVLYAWSAPFNIFTLIFMGVFQNLGRIKFCNTLYPVNCILVPLACCTILSRFIGITAIWACYMLAEIITLTVIYLHASLARKSPARTVDDLLDLGEEMDTDSRISVSITKVDEVVNLSHQIQSFCEEHGIDSRRSMLAGLCMEEMAGNIVEHGFTKDNRKHSIDAFACVEDNDILLRLRDNCVCFDPHDKLKMYSDEDPARNVGIKLVSRIASEMNYQTTFGMNVLNIRLSPTEDGTVCDPPV